MKKIREKQGENGGNWRKIVKKTIKMEENEWQA